MTQPSGKVLQVNVSGGGVPKRPIERAWVSTLGLEGDAQTDKTVHGGPHRAVCLFAMEVIERLQSEGHPIEPGGAGENLTTSGIEWSLMPIGTRARIGDRLELELASSTSPCAKQTGNFSDGNFNRIRIEFHPSDSRMYARVIHEGEVKAGDPITILSPVNESQAQAALMLKRLNRAETKSAVAAWRAAAASGFAVEFVEDGEIALSASSDLPGPAFNSAQGLVRLPNMLPMATDFFDRHDTTGYIWFDGPPWPGAVPFMEGGVVGAYVTDDAVVRALANAAPPGGVTIRRIEPTEVDAFNAVRSGERVAGGVTNGTNPWPLVYEQLAKTHARQLFVAEIDGVAVGNASLHVSAGAGWLRGALVAPEARGRGIQQALIAARIRAAIEAGCDLVGAQAEPGEVSARNLQRMGMRRLGSQNNYAYVPGSAGKS